MALELVGVGGEKDARPENSPSERPEHAEVKV